MVKLTIFVIGGTFLIAALLVFGLNGTGQGRIEINPLKHDVGTVSIVEGFVKRTFEIQNTGEGDLKITAIWTSCMCTMARLKVGDKESPEFGMHSGSLFWSQKIASGQTGFLEVIFDPAFHGDQGTGEIVRAIYISSDDPQNKKVEARLIANVVP